MPATNIKSYYTMRLGMFTNTEKAKPDTEDIRRLNVAAITLTIVSVTRLPLGPVTGHGGLHSCEMLT
jgi:hypothetical protein